MQALRKLFGTTRRARKTNAQALVDEAPRRGQRVDDPAREELARELLYDARRREALKMGLAAGGGVLAALLTTRVIQSAQGAPGDGIAGTTISNTDIDAKRIAGVRIASEFASAKHAGTTADPWPGSAIQSAMDDLPATGGMAFVPAGTWNASSPLTISKSFVRLAGTGSATKIVTDGLGFTPNLSGMIYGSGVYRNIVISDLLLDGQGTDTNFGIYFEEGVDALIQRCFLYNWVGTLSNRARGITIENNPSGNIPPYKPVVVDGCYFANNQIGAVFDHCLFSLVGSIFEDNTWDGVYIDGNQAHGTIANNTVQRSPRTGINVQFGDTDSVIGNTVEDCGVGIELGGSRQCSVIGNRVERCGGAGIGLYASSRYNVIANNIVRDMPSGIVGIEVFNACVHNLFLGNVVWLNGSHGIFIDGGSSENIVRENTCLNNGGDGIYLGTDGNVIVGNKCFDDQATKTQGHGIFEAAGGDGNFLIGNDVRGNSISGLRRIGPSTVASRNIGYQTENRGVAAIPIGGTFVSVPHGLDVVPIVVTLGARHPEVADAYVSARDAVNLTIAVPAAVTAGRSVDWYAEA